MPEERLGGFAGSKTLQGFDGLELSATDTKRAV